MSKGGIWMQDIYGVDLEPGDRVLLSYFGQLKDCYYLYTTSTKMVFSVYSGGKDATIDRKDAKIAMVQMQERQYNPLLHNHYMYYKHVYQGSYYIVEKNNLPEQLKKYLKK